MHKKLVKALAIFGVVLGLLLVSAIPAMANHIDTATVTPSCSSYSIKVTASTLVPGTSYTIDYTFTATPRSGTPTTITDSISFNAPSSGTFATTVTKPLGPLSSTSAFSGAATLVGENTINIAFNPATLTCPSPSICSALGAAGKFAVLGLQGATINLSSGPLRINGNLGIGQNGMFNFSGGGMVTGVLDADNTAQVNISGGGTTITGGIDRMSMLPIENAALEESNNAGSLTPTQTFSSITSSQTIVGNGGQNVILVERNIHLSGGNNLIISGGASDTFIFNVSQGLQLDGGANIVLQGVSPSNVLFNFPGSGDQIQTSGNAHTAGIFLAPNRVIQINGGVHNSEFISGLSLSFQSNPAVNQPCP